jgi:UDP-GlcNAc:undecaprenyl-phosphate GlcNAc-1-phosphate transferase
MGDVGSTFLGFTFAVLTIIATRYDKSHTSLFVVPLLLFHFIFDTIITFFLRLSNKENVFQAHRRHIYQLLNRLGLTHLKVTLIYSMLAIFQGGIAIWMVNGLGEGRQLIFLPVFCLYSILTYLVLLRAHARHLI